MLPGSSITSGSPNSAETFEAASSLEVKPKFPALDPDTVEAEAIREIFEKLFFEAKINGLEVPVVWVLGNSGPRTNVLWKVKQRGDLLGEDVRLDRIGCVGSEPREDLQRFADGLSATTLSGVYGSNVKNYPSWFQDELKKSAVRRWFDRAQHPAKSDASGMSASVVDSTDNETSVIAEDLVSCPSSTG